MKLNNKKNKNDFLYLAQNSSQRICIVKGWIHKPNDNGKDHTWCGQMKKTELLFLGPSHFFLSFHKKEGIRVCLWCALAMIKTIIISIFRGGIKHV